MNKIDAHIIEKVQEAYLWFYDRTGILVASIIVALIGIQAMAVIALPGHPVFKWIMAFMLLLNGLSVFVRWHLQVNAKFERYNATALDYRESRSRKFFIGLSFSIAVLEALFGNTWWSVLFVAQVVDWFVRCIMIRERDPKSFFELSPKASGGAA